MFPKFVGMQKVEAKNLSLASVQRNRTKHCRKPFLSATCLHFVTPGWKEGSKIGVFQKIGIFPWIFLSLGFTQHLASGRAGAVLEAVLGNSILQLLLGHRVTESI